MTLLNDVKEDPKYRQVLDYGFVGLVDYMGSDSSIVQAARVSYGTGTKTSREDRGLLRYLLRMRHTSPIEMCQVKIHIKCPIFVMRQLVRHRTSSLNEYSGRYSIMTDEFYIPEIENIKPQSTTNKQGRAGSTSPADALAVQQVIRDASTDSYKLYQNLLGDIEHDNYSNQFDKYGAPSEEFEGIARESARMVLPLNNYTELYWNQNLWNMFHLLKLRMDEHAQWEIREYANAIYNLIQPLFPHACEAFEDYVRQSLTLSRMEKELLYELMNPEIVDTHFRHPKEILNDKISQIGSMKLFAETRGLSERELREFITTWNLNG